MSLLYSRYFSIMFIFVIEGEGTVVVQLPSTLGDLKTKNKHIKLLDGMAMLEDNVLIRISC